MLTEEQKRDFILRMTKGSGTISDTHSGERLFAPMMPTCIVEEKNLSETIAMYAWQRYLYRHGWNIAKNGNFIGPEHAKKMNQDDLTLKEEQFDDHRIWVNQDADLYDQWVKELEKL